MENYQVLAVGETNCLRYSYDETPDPNLTKGMGFNTLQNCIGRILDGQVTTELNTCLDRWDLTPPPIVYTLTEAMGRYGSLVHAKRLEHEEVLYRHPVECILFIKDVFGKYMALSCGVTEGDIKREITLKDFAVHISRLEDSIRSVSHRFASKSFIRGMIPNLSKPSKKKSRIGYDTNISS